MKKYLLPLMIFIAFTTYAKAEVKEIAYDGTEITINAKKDHLVTIIFPEAINGVTRGYGADSYVVQRMDKEVNIDKPRSRLVLLAKTFAGYQNLIKLVTLSNTEGFYYRPRIDDEILKKYKNDLIAIIPSFAGEVAQALKDNNPNKAEERLDWYKNIFGDDCYLEISHHPEVFGHQENQAKIKELAKKTNTPLVAAHDVYYL